LPTAKVTDAHDLALTAYGRFPATQAKGLVIRGRVQHSEISDIVRINGYRSGAATRLGWSQIPRTCIGDGLNCQRQTRSETRRTSRGPQKYREAAADFSLVIDSRPELRLAYWYRSQANFGLDQTDDAIADINAFVALDPPQTDSATSASRHLAMGKALRNVAQQLPTAERTGALEAAADELQSAIAVGPATAEMWRHLGAVRELLKEFPRAIEAYARGLEFDPKDAQLRNMRAWTNINANQNLDLAMADFQGALVAEPENAEARVGLGFVLAELGKEDDSRREASIALLNAAENHLILHNVACIYARLSAAESERRIEYENLAIASLQRAVSVSRANPLGQIPTN
jgi:tetratricopeptide (TPR) repeat protein